jgi:uncharacterized zinc-type alcohol dehydrogenase-like protein
MASIRAWAARGPKKPLEPFEYDPGPLGPEDVEVAVDYCGICHSDLSVTENEWGITKYPVVPGHEVIGRVVAVGEMVGDAVKVGQRVGVGWNASSCMRCRHCVAGDQHHCVNVQSTIVGHHGGFAERVRAKWVWAIPIPEGLDASSTGPMLCGGITVFSPLLSHNIKPTQRVGVIGIGGLGHMAVKFLKAWGCEVTAFTSSESKYDEARGFGAHRVVSSRNPDTIKAIAGSMDMIISTVNVPLDWAGVLAALAPRGRLHVVGAVLEPIPVSVPSLIFGEKSISASPTGSRTQIDDMLAFAARHAIAPQVEHYPMSRVNEAFEHLKAGRARYRIVLDADFK